MMSSSKERLSYEEPLSPIGRTQLGLAASFVTPSLKKKDENSNRVVDDKPFINKRKPLSTTVVKGVLTA
jgi:hypothetical protein